MTGETSKNLPRDLSGIRFGRLVAISKTVIIGKNSYWMCRCDCGVRKEIRRDSLINGSSTSCGCFRSEDAAQRMTIHGCADHELYAAWKNMMGRCYDPSNNRYEYYGARGIIVCERWHLVENYIEDIENILGPRPPGMSLDRKDNNGNYELTNVRWATSIEQRDNRSDSWR